jgi:formylglycine-generating enzyme required for sulfatase activity
VNIIGNVVDRPSVERNYFIEDLGGGVELYMVYIPGGTFEMGSPTYENDRNKDESPQHLVTVKPFVMGVHEVTWTQWQAVAQLPKVARELNPNPTRYSTHRGGYNTPVNGVSWYDAKEFCARLSEKTGRDYRLPSEAEWEYAARAGTTTPFTFGPTISVELVNYYGKKPYKHAPKVDHLRGCL